jgi:hypothetical protein
VKEGSSGGDDLYFVEQLLEHKIVNKKTSYLIKWLNYDLSANSWEPESNIGSGALKEYWIQVSRKVFCECISRINPIELLGVVQVLDDVLLGIPYTSVTRDQF